MLIVSDWLDYFDTLRGDSTFEIFNGDYYRKVSIKNVTESTVKY